MGTESYKHLKVQTKNNIGVIAVAREEVRNSLNIETLHELEKALLAFEPERQIKAVIITGSGPKVFASGADLKEAAQLTAEKRKIQIELGHHVFSLIENFRTPVIAAINGHALGGGCELALACDIRIIEEHAKIGLVEVGIGTIPGWGGTQRLANIVGLGMAKEMIFTGVPLTAAEAKEIRLVNRVVPSGESLQAAVELAERICRNGPYAVQICKMLVNQSVQDRLPSGIRLEKTASQLIFQSKDRTEGIRAFLEKRSPSFTGE